MSTLAVLKSSGLLHLRSHATLFACGAMAALGFAPIGLFPLTILGLAGLLAVWSRAASRRDGFSAGFAFGLGFFLVGVSWVYVSMHVYGEVPALLAALATLLFCSYLALFPALAGWLVARSPLATTFRLLIVGPAAFVATEWLRGWLFTGFPWLGVGYTQAPNGWLSGFAPILGLYGLSWLVLLSAGLLVMAWSFRKDSKRVFTAAPLLVVALLWGSGWYLMQIEWSVPTGAPLKVALLQGNIAQDQKWRADVREATLSQYRSMVLASDAQLIVLPETALPMFLDQVPAAYLEDLRRHTAKREAVVLMGTVERTQAEGAFDYYNSVTSIDQSEQQVYRKSHLVPFGEYIPTGFGWVLNILKIPLTDFARGAITQQPLVIAGQRIAANICYEDAFGEEIIRQLPTATMMVNLSNMAWFGNSWAADQHFQMSQMRAQETSRWMLRATNTGLTGAIDERGRTVARLPQFKADSLSVSAQGRTGITPYVMAGNWPILGILLLCLVLTLLHGARAKR